MVKTIDVSIPTKGWFFFSKPGLFKGTPAYINAAASVKNGVLSLTREDIVNSRIDPEQQNFYYYTLFPDKYDVGMDNFSLKTRIAFKAINNVACPMIVHEVCGQSNSLYFYTTLPGCTGNINLNVGEHFLSGKTTDLSGFGGDVHQWQDVEVIVKDKEATFYINGQKVYSKAYTTSPGHQSPGLLSCQMAFVKLTILNSKVLMANWFMRITSLIDPASDSVLTTTANPEPEPLINRMLLHVHENIHSSDKLRISYLASHFNLSANYVGEYFRKLTGESLHHLYHPIQKYSSCNTAGQ